MTFKCAVKNNDNIYFITTAIVNWIDLFTRTEYTEIIINSLNYCGKSKGLNIHAWCLMPGHLHLIVSVKQEIFKLPDIRSCDALIKLLHGL